MRYGAVIAIGLVGAALAASFWWSRAAPPSTAVVLSPRSDGAGAAPSAAAEPEPTAASAPASAAQRSAAQGARGARVQYDAEAFKGAPLPERLNSMSMRRDGKAFDPDQVAQALQSAQAWEQDPKAADSLALSAAERKDGREFIRLDPLKIEALMPGDEITLPIKQASPQGVLKMVVERVEQDKGSVTWHGTLKDYPTENQVSFTRGTDLIVGGIFTPDRNYVVQVHGNVGWVVNGFTLFKGRHDAPTPPGTDGAALPHGPHQH